MAIDLAQLTMNFDRRYALCFQKLYHRSHFTVGGCWNKSIHLKPLQRYYCENSESPASACVIRRHYSIMYTESLHVITGLLAVGRVGNLICGCPRPLYKTKTRDIHNCDLYADHFPQVEKQQLGGDESLGEGNAS